ncbi:hypothetical protein PLESTB_000475000 [Pleodorina starrii]|uniref:Fe2OG dioxygenase domain-containing protein n=1 Tax=Pleodorina starrii TaxID=330485 RepID=A0A9W6BFJ4_9CHLO|nr:hypothetical protein PLESTM_001591700 [Pleodorina starrii]GLC51184.1 hypothetical protein PLESTB_000475000 [Pleodorina starrii]GLC63542.1 hypothetical protein PLESTF_000047500 [Pleodorina starrii]
MEHHGHNLGLHHTHSSQHHHHLHSGLAPPLGLQVQPPSSVPVNVAPTAPAMACQSLHDHPPKPTLSERISIKVSRTLRRVPNVPGLLALALCSVAFWFGRISLTTSMLPEPAGPVLNARLATLAHATSQRRSLQEKSTEVRLVRTESTAAVLPAIDPYDLNTFEAAVSKGLEALKPAMTPGDTGEAFYRMVPFQILSWYPRIVVFPSFVDKARREEIVTVASRFLYPSGLAYRPGETVDAGQQVRTSTGTFLNGDTTPALRWLEDKIAAVTLLPRANGEFWNVLNYKHSQHYDSHMDSFDPKEYGPQPSQRIATVIVVLSDDKLVGGETVFKREGKLNAKKSISNWTDCDADGGLKYKPRAGDAILFWSARPDGKLDPHALHGSCPVVTGDKWVAVKWIRDQGEYRDE